MLKIIILSFIVLCWGSLSYFARFAPRACTGDKYWSILLNRRFYFVDESPDLIVIALRERHGILYFKVNRLDAKTAYSPAIIRYTEQLIDRMEEELKQFGETSSYWGDDLHILTAENFGTDLNVWRDWFRRNRDSFKASQDAFVNLREAREVRKLKESDGLRTKDDHASVEREFKVNRRFSKAILCGLSCGILVFGAFYIAQFNSRSV